MEEIYIIVALTCAAVFALIVSIITLCCVLKRRPPAVKKMFVRLTQPRPSYCTLISNNAPYQRVLDEYEVKVKLMDSSEFDDFELQCDDNETKGIHQKVNGKRRLSCEKNTPRYQTSVEFPQWKVAENKPLEKSHYNL